MWSTPSDREKAERRELEARIERIALQHPDEERTLTIQVKFNPREAVRYSEFIQGMVEAGHSIEDAIVGNISALLESDNIADSGDVERVA